MSTWRDKHADDFLEDADMTNEELKEHGRLMGVIQSADFLGMREIVLPLLERGDSSAVRRFIDWSRDSEDGCDDAFAEVTENTSQCAVVGGVPHSLFCIPFLVDSDVCEDMPTEALSEALSAYLGAGAEFTLVDGWVHMLDLVELDPVGYFKMAQAAAATHCTGASAIPHGSLSLPRGPVVRGDLGGGAAFVGLSARPSSAARLVVGIARDCASADSLLRRLVDGDLSREEAQALTTGLSQIVGGGALSLEPGRPVWASVGLEASIACIAFEARIEAAALLAARKPIVDICVYGDAILATMTSDGTQFIDHMEMSGIGIDSDQLFSILEKHAAGYVIHETPDSMPSRPRRQVH